MRHHVSAFDVLHKMNRYDAETEGRYMPWDFVTYIPSNRNCFFIFVHFNFISFFHVCSFYSFGVLCINYYEL